MGCSLHTGKVLWEIYCNQKFWCNLNNFVTLTSKMLTLTWTQNVRELHPCHSFARSTLTFFTLTNLCIQDFTVKVLTRVSKVLQDTPPTMWMYRYMLLNAFNRGVRGKLKCASACECNKLVLFLECHNLIPPPRDPEYRIIADRKQRNRWI